MATKSENADIAVLQTQMSNVEAAVQRIENKIDNQAANFVTHSEFESYKKSQTWQKISQALAAVVLGALITYFFSTVGQ